MVSNFSFLCNIACSCLFVSLLTCADLAWKVSSCSVIHISTNLCVTFSILSTPLSSASFFILSASIVFLISSASTSSASRSTSTFFNVFPGVALTDCRIQIGYLLNMYLNDYLSFIPGSKDDNDMKDSLRSPPLMSTISKLMPPCVLPPWLS